MRQESKVGLGFVLLARAELPGAEAILAEYRRLAPDGPALHTPDLGDAVVTFKHGDAMATAGLMPAAVPRGEAEHHAQYSIVGLAGRWKLPPHHAHIVVATMNAGGTPLERTRATHRLIAAVAAAAGDNAVGVYVGNGGVTHEPRFYVATVGESPDAIVAWSGVSVARDGERASLLSTGMGQLGLPDVEVTVKTTPPSEAIAALYDILLYVARRGERLPEGDTIGTSAEQKLPVRYVPSPADDTVEVMRVELP